jgi:spore germination protein GerM
VDTVASDVDKAIAHGCEVVDETSQQANTILDDVKKATLKMNGSATQAMDQFVFFIDKEGEDISKKLENHFCSIEKHLQQQQSGFEEMKENTLNHQQNIHDTVLLPVGSTPKTKNYRKKFPPDIVTTREHENIKLEVKELLKKMYFDK